MSRDGQRLKQRRPSRPLPGSCCTGEGRDYLQGRILLALDGSEE